MYKYIPQAGDTEVDELKGKIRELKEQLAGKNKKLDAMHRKIVEALQKKIHDILNTPINAHGETVEIVLARQNQGD